MKSTILTTLLLIAFQITVAQNITGRILDKTTKEPVPYAAIQFDEYDGTMSNEEGYFSVSETKAKQNGITISCMGYSSKEMSLEQLRNAKNIILLDEAVNQLAEVYLSNRAPNPDSIIAKVRTNLTKNYNYKNVQQQVFYRETTYTDFEDLDLEIEKASHVRKEKIRQANGSLDSLAKAVMNNRMIFFKEYKGNLMAAGLDSVKLQVDLATKLIDKKKDFSIENIQEKAQKIVLQYLDQDKTYKLKTGWFTVEDEMSLDDLENDEPKKNEYSVPNLKDETMYLVKNSQFDNNSLLREVLNPELYEYKFISLSYVNTDLIYIVDFLPRKSKSKFAGRLFVNDKDFAVVKSDYGYSEGKRGSKLNLKLLLGVKYIENLQNGTVIYRQDSTKYYRPYYAKEETGRYFYVSRPLKFIENSLAKNKVSFDFVIEGDLRNKKEILFSDNTELNKLDFANLKELKNIPFTELSRYDASIWKNTEVIEPLQEMKNFNSSQKENE